MKEYRIIQTKFDNESVAHTDALSKLSKEGYKLINHKIIKTAVHIYYSTLMEKDVEL